MIYWFTGQPGAGKTVLAKALQVTLTIIQKIITILLALAANQVGVANIGTEKNGPSREEMVRVKEKQAVTQSFSVDRTDPLPISNEDWVKAATVTPPKAPPACCAKGNNLVTGVSKTNGKPYYGYLCLDRIKEHAIWAKQDANGNWFFPQGKEE